VRVGLPVLDQSAYIHIYIEREDLKIRSIYAHVYLNKFHVPVQVGGPVLDQSVLKYIYIHIYIERRSID